MKPRYRWVLSLLLLGALPASLLACLWDYDTLKQERSRFPSTLELITGKFLRHSPAFYRWRIEDRLKKLKADPKELAYYDDLSVAYEKTGQHDKAIETILTKEKIKPGLYETYSNLGTFYILAGDFKQGLPYIDKALAINPDAHFGREKYQKWLVEYALAKFPDGKIPFPLQVKPRDPAIRKPGYAPIRQHAAPFHDYLAAQAGVGHLTVDELQKGVKAVLGMMRFADHENPLLLEALADLLSGEYPSSDAKRLAARAYLKASYVVKDELAKNSYRALARTTLELQIADPKAKSELALEDLEADFKNQLEEADRWYADLRAKEISWIEKGLDPEKEFDALYTEEPIVQTIGDHAGTERADPPESAGSFFLINLLADRTIQVAGLVLAAVTGLFLALKLWNTLTQTPPST